jgi:Paraquat-inducible protein A
MVTLGLLIPGLVLPVITVRGMLQPVGLAELAPKLLSQGISDQSIVTIKPLINPAILPLLEMAPGGLKSALVNRLSTQLAAELKNSQEIEIYQQTRSILGSVQHLYRVHSYTAATLILLFSVIVPFGKMLLVSVALFLREEGRRRRILHFVEIIAKWSMADVFAVALFITYLAAQATQTPPGSTGSAIVAFSATFGPGFYWFAAYCVVSLAVQQMTARLVGSTAPVVSQ